MSIAVSYNGSTYNIPQYNDTGWAQNTGNLTLYLVALASGLSGYVGNITLTTPGAGLIVTTPDGLHTYRIRIDNDGVIGSEQVT